MYDRGSTTLSIQQQLNRNFLLNVWRLHSFWNSKRAWMTRQPNRQLCSYTESMQQHSFTNDYLTLERWFVVHARFGGLLPLCRRKSRRDDDVKKTFISFFQEKGGAEYITKGAKKYHRCSIVRSIRLLDDRQKWRSQELPAGPTTSHHIGWGHSECATSSRHLSLEEISLFLLSSSDWKAKNGNKPLVNFWLFSHHYVKD